VGEVFGRWVPYVRPSLDITYIIKSGAAPRMMTKVMSEHWSSHSVGTPRAKAHDKQECQPHSDACAILEFALTDKDTDRHGLLTY
jgi:hypothetical protein